MRESSAKVDRDRTVAGWTRERERRCYRVPRVSYLPSKRFAVVVFTTQGPKGKPSTAYASAIYNRIGRLLAPKQPPSAQVCPRPPC